MKILILDDDENIVSMISDFLTINNMTSVKAYDFDKALFYLKNSDIDLIILDVNLGDENYNGFEFCKKVRTFSTVPIIFLTAKTSQSDKILGLGLGGDDYLTKPFDPLELVARIRSLLRRSQIYDENLNKEEINIHNYIKLDMERRAVLIDNKMIELSSTEFYLLKYLLENSNRIVTRQEILLKVWNSELYTENIVNTYIMRLREKIEKDKNNPEYLLTIRGEGYLLKNL